MNIVKSVLKLSSVKFLKVVLSFLGIVFFARKLGATSLGSFFLFQALLTFCSIPADFGLRGSLEKRISEGEDHAALLSSAIILKTIPILAIGFTILLLADIVNEYLGADLAVYLVITIVLQELSLLTQSVLRGELRVEETASLTLAQTVVWIGLGSLLLFFGFGVEALVYGLITGFTITLVWGWYKCSTTIGKPSFIHMRSLFNYGQYNFVSSIGGYAYNWIDIALIGVFLTPAHVSAYEIAWRITSITIVFSRAIATTIFPQVSQWAAKDATEQIESIIAKTIPISLLLVIPAFFGILLFSEEILGLVFGREYTVAWLALIILMSDKLFQAIQVIIARSLQAINHPELAARAAVVSLTTNIVLNIPLIWKFGIVGAAVATVTASLVNDFLHMLYLSRFVSLRFQWRKIGWCIFSSVLMAITLFHVKSMMDVDDITVLTGVIVLAVILYGILVLVYSPIRIQVKQLVESF